MQLLENLLTDWKIFLKSLLKGNIEPLVKIVKGIEYFRHKKMQ